MNWKDRTPIPGDVRAAVLRRANDCCERCGATPVELHHLIYWEHGVEIFGREVPEHLLALCRACHLSQHIGPNDEFYANPQECADEWDYFDHVMEKDD